MTSDELRELADLFDHAEATPDPPSGIVVVLLHAGDAGEIANLLRKEILRRVVS